MNVLIVAHGVPDQSLLGGPGRVARLQALGLARRGHEVHIVTSDLVDKGRTDSRVSFDLLGQPSIRVTVLHAQSLRWWPGSIGPVRTADARQHLDMAAGWADVVIAHEWQHSMTQMACACARRRAAAVVVQPHGAIRYRRGVKAALHRAFGLLHPPRDGEHFLATSEAEAEDIAGQLGTGVVVHSLVNPVDLEPGGDPAAAARARRRWGFADDSVVLLYAHRVVPNKGLDILIRALALLDDSFCLVVIGPDDHAPRFARRCRALSGDLGVAHRVRFVGPVSQTEMPAVMSSADVFVLPARHDIFPMTVLSALALGRPVVMTGACQSAALLASAAAIAEPEPSSLAATIGALSAERRAELSRAGPELVRRQFSVDVVAERLEGILERAVSRRESGAELRGVAGEVGWGSQGMVGALSSGDPSPRHRGGDSG